MTTLDIKLTDREIFAKVTVRAIQSVVTYGLAVAVVLGVWLFLPRISVILSVPAILLFILIALWNLGGVLLGVIVAVGRVFGAWQDQPFDAKWLWAAHGVRFTESVIYLGLAALLYRVVWTS